MGMITASLIINFFLIFLSLVQFLDKPGSEYFVLIVFIILLIFWLMSLAGSILYLKTKKNSYGKIAIVGFAVYFPIGLIGVMGLRKIMDEEKRKEMTLDNNEKGELND